MGLSDGKRYAQVAGVVDHLARLPRFQDYGHTGLNQLLDRLWSDFIGGTSNGGHWIMGSESGADHLAECSLLGAAFAQARGSALRGAGVASAEWSPAPSAWRDQQRVADALTYLVGEERQVLEVLRACEGYFYAANRYEDKLSAALAPLTKTVSDLRGLVHHLTATNPVYAVAWMLQTIADRCFRHDDHDPVTTAGARFNWHHDLRADGQDFAAVYALFKRYQFARVGALGGVGAALPMRAEDRLATVLALVGRRFHYAHMHRELAQIIRAHNARTHLYADLTAQGLTPEEAAKDSGVATAVATAFAVDTIDEARILGLCAAAQLAHTEHAAGREYHPYCHFTGQEG